MTKIIILADKKDSHQDKLKWLISELQKRDSDIIVPCIDSEDSFDSLFKQLSQELAPDTLIVAKGIIARLLLKRLETFSAGVKGLFIITDETNKHEILELDYSKIKKRVMKFFIYAFQNNHDFPLTEAHELADKIEAELFVLEGAEDYSDYEDILIDILSLENE